MKVLVTGGSGFIGSHVVDKLLAAGHEPVVFDLRPSPHHDPGDVRTIVGDLFDGESLREALDGCRAVIHLAAAADVGIVAEAPEEAERVNARGTLAVLEAARSTGIGRVIYGSTIWAYGDSGNGNGVIDEDTLLGLPKHLYTASKVAGEMYCTSYAALYDVPCTILRFGIPYGPRARPAAVIPIFVRKALAGEALTIAGDGSQGRRFVYVEDLAEGVVKALDRGADNRVYNLASDTTVTIRELAETVQELVGDVDIVYTPGRNGDFDGAEISSSRAELELGWRASTPLREGVRRYMTWLAADTEPQPAPVAAPETPPALAPEPGVAADSSQVPRRSGLRTTVGRLGWPSGVFGDGPTVAFACAIATLITYVIALRSRSLDDAQTHAVGLTTIVWTLGGLMLLQTASVRRLRMGITWALWLLALYVGLMTLHWTKEKFELALPGIHTLILSGFGLLIALAVAWGITRWRRESPASDEVL